MRPSAAIAMIAMLPLSVAIADVYKSVDAQGHVLYSDTPTPGAELVRASTTHVAATSPQPAKPAPVQTQAKPEEPVTDPATREAAERAVASDVAQTREQQCAKAKEEYEKAVAARRIYSVGPSGEREFLTTDQAQQQRVDAKLRVDQLCNNPGG